MIKAIFFDIDGTLFSPATRSIPADALDALAAARRRGVKLFIATGRHPTDCEFLRHHFDFDGYVMMNGQYCTLAGGTLVRKQAFTPAELATLQEILVKNHFPTWFMLSDGLYIAGRHPSILARYEETGNPVPPVLAPEALAGKEVLQVDTYANSPAEMEAIAAHFPTFQVTRSSPVYLDVLPAGGGKQVGMAAMLAHFGFAQAESMAFGDGHNDAEMLRYAGIGVAMENCHESLPGLADHVTADVDAGGIAKALRHFGVI